MKSIRFVPFYAGETEERVFDPAAEFNFPSVLQRALAGLGYDLSTRHPLNEAAFVLLFRLDARTALDLWRAGAFDRTLYLAMEPPVVRPMHAPRYLRRLAGVFRNVLTWQDDLLTERGVVKFHYPMPRRVRPVPVPFEQKQLITTVAGKKNALYPDELYSERVRAIRYFERKLGPDFGFYGTGWDRERFPSWRGTVDDKLSTLARYRFSLNFENQKNINGLFSEKIFDSMLASCIPVFWGAANVEETVPRDCFVDMRKFPDYEALHAHLAGMNAETYGRMLQAIDRFLGSEVFQWFTGESVARRLVAALEAPVRPQARPTLPGVAGVLTPMFVSDLWWRGLNRLARDFT